MSPLRAALVAVLALVVALPVALAAQGGSTTDILRGRVTGEGGEPLVGAQVLAKSLETGITRSTLTDTNGRYTIAFPDGGGRYQITAGYIGAAPRVVTVERQADEDVLLANVRLAIQPVQLEGIEVTARRPPPGRGEAGSQGRTMSSELLERLPLPDFDPATIAQLTPGVVGTTTGDSLDLRNAFSVAGMRTSLNQTTLDGASFSSSLTGGSAGAGSPLSVPQEGVRGTTVITSSYDVSRGQFAGGQVAMTTRGGTNQRQGTVTYNYRSSALNGAGDVWGNGFAQHRFSGGFGGPIKRNKLFYFVSGAAQHRADDQFALRPRDPSALLRIGVADSTVDRFLSILNTRYGVDPAGQTGPFARTWDALSLMGRADWIVTQRHSLMLRGNANLSSQDSARIGVLSLRQNGGDVGTQSVGGMATLTSRLGGGWINELRASYTDDRRDMLSFAQVPAGNVRVQTTLPDGTPGISTLSFGGNRSLPVNTRESTLEVSDELSFLVGDAHRIKAGGFLNHSSFDQLSTSNRFGSFTFNSLADFEARHPASFTRTLTPRQHQGGGLNSALYVGDSWRPANRVQVTGGARLEGSWFDATPAYNPLVDTLFGRRTDEVPSEVHVSPRAGFSWRLGEGRSARVIRGGLGEFRGRAPFSLYSAALDQTGLGNTESQLTCVGESVPTPDYPAYFADPAAIPTGCASLPVPAFASGRPNVTLFDRDFGAPRSWRGSFGVSGPIVGLLQGSLDLMYSRGVGLYGVRDLNLRTGSATPLPAESGRPLYASPSTIAPTTGAVSPVSSRLHPELNSVFDVTGNLASSTAQGTFTVNGILPPRIFFQASYTLSRSRDQSSFSCCTPEQGFAQPTTAGDPNLREWGTSDMDRRHMLLGMVGMPVTPSFELTLIGRANSGAPYTPMVGGDINGDGYRNDRAFIFGPVAATGVDTSLFGGMARLLATAPSSVRECLSSQAGRVAGRNSCRAGWFTSLDGRATWHPQVPRLGRRIDVSLDATNLPAGLDRLLHGSNDLHGWGQPDRPDETLLYPRGFDPQTNSFRYEVNGLFGQSRTQRFGFGSPFQLQLSVRVGIGPQSGAFGGLAGIAFGGMRGPGGGGPGDGGGRGGFGGRMGGQGGGFDVNQMLDRLFEDPVSLIYEMRDTLKLTPDQVSKVKQIDDSLQVKLKAARAQVQEKLKGADTSNPMAAFQTVGPVVRQSRTDIQQAARAAQKVLSKEQWNRLPARVKDAAASLGGLGGPRRP